MSGRVHPPIPPTSPQCRKVLEALRQDPLDPGPEALAHLDACPACSEARILWLAQEDAPPALAPAGYFEQLPGRVLRKLPPARRPRRSTHLLLWGAAAALLAVGSMGGFLAGRSRRAPLVEAKTEPTPPAEKAIEVVPDAPFHEEDEVATQLADLSPKEAQALVERLERKQPGITKQDRK